MPSLEAVCGRLFGRPGWIPKVLWGGALCFIPILNLFAFGYLLEYGRQIRQSNQWDLPDWRDQDIPTLLLSGIRLLLLLLAFIGTPLLVGWILSLLILGLSFGMLGIIAYFPLAAAGFAAPFLFLASLHAYLEDGIFSNSFQLQKVYRSALAYWPKLGLPVIAFWGIFLLALPLYGISFFLGVWVLIAYSTALQFAR